MVTATTREMVTFGGAAQRIGRGVTWRHIARLAQRGLIQFAQADHIRLVHVADLDEIQAACARAGYLRPAHEEDAHAAH